MNTLFTGTPEKPGFTHGFYFSQYNCAQFNYLPSTKPLLMQHAANILTALIAGLHLYILVLEMFWWDTPKGRRAFGMTPEFSAATKVLAANQGLYNGFLAAGLIWGVSLGEPGNNIKVFFLACVVVAGVYGALTASRKILFIQALPGAVALAAVLLA
jgi:putative membrane protein